MKKLAATLSLMLLLTGCTSIANCSKDTGHGDAFDNCDPAKPVNNGIFQFNLGADTIVVRPLSRAYHHIPDTGRVAISNFLTNLSEPANVLNGVLQLDFQMAGTSLWRFLLNTTLGFGGLRDFAGENGLKYQDQTFNKTLARYWVPDGSYVVLPILGPSTIRDTTGQVVDWFTDPLGWYMTTTESIAEGVTNGIETRDERSAVIDQLYYESLDPYTATRAAYLQHEAHVDEEKKK